MKKLFWVLLLLVPLSASADQIRYNFVGTGAGGSTGYLIFNDASGPGNIISDLVGWSFTWNGYTVTEANTSLFAASFFNVDASLMFVSAGICVSATGDCIATPYFTFLGANWRAANQGADSVIQSGTLVTGPFAVPEPGTLSLLGACLLALVALRRKRAARTCGCA